VTLVRDTVPRTGEQPEVAALTSFATRFGVAGVDEKPMGPGLEPIGIPEARQMTPRVEQGLLGGVLGEARITQDPARQRMQGVADASDELVEGLFVVVPRSLDELALHVSPALCADRGVRPINEYECACSPSVQLPARGSSSGR
jgi:hypothetical protein